MVIYLTYKQILKSIRFPVYALQSEDFYFRDGLLMLDELVVDDTNQSGDTLGKRRLQTPHKLKRIGKVYEEFLDLVKSRNNILIDASGAVFSYKKTKYQDVKSLKITKKEYMDTHSRIWVKGVNFPFLLSSPALGCEYAQVLFLGEHPWLLYGLSEIRLKDMKRKV